ncbi:uncharacterized protein LOC134291326 [Aedes albopictus]|uniref:Peptidase aspartic putative domain-containing protein n=1 Tax=Aedes albopictus TaxID=7160 RepID=A0ABM1YRD0_AEDAL
MVCSRLDQSILRDWERSTSNNKKKIPTYSELITFLKDHARILFSLNSGSITPLCPMEKPHQSGAYTAAVSNPSPPKATSCIVCNQSHRIYDCEEFKRMELDQKQDTVRRKKLCWNCLGSSHFSRECSSKPCRKCNENHHTLLHPFTPNDRCTRPQSNPPDQYVSDCNDESVIPALLSIPSPLASTTTPATQQPTFNSLAAANSYKTSLPTVLLSTAVVKVHGPSGRSTLVRTLLDSCSESNFITDRIVQLLGLNRRKQPAVIAGMGGSTVNSHQCTIATFSSVDSTYSNTLTFNILPTITNHLPGKRVDTSDWDLPSTVILADPDFAKPRSIDMVIGAQLFFSLLREGQLSVAAGSPANQPILQRTVLGWVVSGPVTTKDQSQKARPLALLCTTVRHVKPQQACYVRRPPGGRGPVEEKLLPTNRHLQNRKLQQLVVQHRTLRKPALIGRFHADSSEGQPRVSAQV